jgi:hypothetical protein
VGVAGNGVGSKEGRRLASIGVACEVGGGVALDGGGKGAAKEAGNGAEKGDAIGPERSVSTR